MSKIRMKIKPATPLFSKLVCSRTPFGFER